MISIENVGKIYGTRHGPREVLHDINLTIHRGEKIGILGRNGAGKSTLSKLMCGFEKEDRGVIRYKGEDIKDKTIKEITY